MRWLSVLSLFAATLTACSSSPWKTCTGRCDAAIGDRSSDSARALQVTPASATVTAGQKQIFAARLLSGEDVTERASWTVDNAELGSFSAPGGFATSSTRGGVATITASFDGLSGSATLSISINRQVIDPSAPATAPSAFPGTPSTDPTETPQIAYPLDGALLARNIAPINIQWTRAAKDTLFRLRFSGPAIDLSFFLGSALCGGSGVTTQCSFVPSPSDWQMLATSCAGSSATLTVEGTAAVGQPVAASTPVALSFSPQDVKGAVYYFAPQIGDNFGGTIERVPIGAQKFTDFIKNGNSHGCVGCHTVSRDGKKVFGLFGNAGGGAGVVDGSDGQKYLIQPDFSHEKFSGDFASYSPDGSRLITNWNHKLTLRDGDTGQAISEVPASAYPDYTGVAMPEWSPDGQSIVCVGIPAEGSGPDWDLSQAGAILVIPYNGGTFGAAKVVVPSVFQEAYHFYPSWSPDSKWIVFATTSYPGSSIALPGVIAGSYDQGTARLRLVKAAGGAPLELTRATHVANRTSTWPKFAPFVQGSLVFFTFNARFAYGFVVPENAQPQLWMSAIDLVKASAGSEDPSYAPVWLPFQDPQARNHYAVWTSEVICIEPVDCPVGYDCKSGACVPLSIR